MFEIATLLAVARNDTGYLFHNQFYLFLVRVIVIAQEIDIFGKRVC
jgi:hypothetical protein